MHTLIVTDIFNYRQNVQRLVNEISKSSEKSCYISFNDPYNIIVELIKEADPHKSFIVLDASQPAKFVHEVNKETYVLPLEHIFSTYLFLRNLVMQQGVSMVLIDSLSALINKHPDLPLQRMLSDLLLEIGTMKCSSSLIVLKDHAEHNVVSHIMPMVGRNIYM